MSEEGMSEEVEIPTPDSMMDNVSAEMPDKESDEDEDVKGVMLSMSRLAAKPVSKQELKKKGKKVK